MSTPEDRLAWIDALTDEECMEVFWLYVDPFEPFLARFPPRLLGAALRHALREVARATADGAARSEEVRPA